MMWNANSVKPKTNELLSVIHSEDINILALSETKLEQTDAFKLPGYLIYRNDRNHHGGGVALAIKNNILHNQIHIQPQNFIETVGIKIKLVNGQDITFIAIYCPPNSRITPQNLRDLYSGHNKVVILGDWDARHRAWNCFTANRNGNLLLDHCLRHNIQIQYSDEPTYVSTRHVRPSTVDLAITKNLNNITKPESKSILNSDHNPVFFKISDQVEFKTNKIRLYKQTNWKQFQTNIDSNLDNRIIIRNAEELENRVGTFINIVNNAIENNIPLGKIKPRYFNIPPEIQVLINIKNYYRRKFKRNRLREDKALYLDLTIEIKRKLYNWRNDTWGKFLETLKPQDGTLWKITKYLTKSKTPIPPLEANGNYVYTKSDKANLLGDYFAEIHHQNDNLGSVNHINNINTYVDTFIEQNRNITFETAKLSTPKEIMQIIKSLKTKKNPGIDNITAIVIKNFSKKATAHLTMLINKMLMFGYYPTLWKIAKVIAICKPRKNPTVATNYRPISLLNILAKVTEKVISTRINTFLTELAIQPHYN